MKVTTVEKAYAAGFFDGEGFITIASRTMKEAKGPIYTMRVGAAQNDLKPLWWLRARWGGSISAAKRRTTGGNVTHTWICCSRQAEAFLRDVLPHLKVKRKRALLALRFQDELFIPGPGGHTDYYRETLALFKGQMNYLNTHKSRRQRELETA